MRKTNNTTTVTKREFTNDYYNMTLGKMAKKYKCHLQTIRKYAANLGLKKHTNRRLIIID